MNNLSTNQYIMIALGLLAVLFLVMWMMSAAKRKREQARLLSAHESEREMLIQKEREQAEAVRRRLAEQHAEEKAAYDDKVSRQSTQIDSLKMMTKDGGEYLTDMTLIQLKERLVRNERIRPEDMHVLANIFIPGRDLKRTIRIPHIVLTRTGIYILNSHYWKGHIYHGVNQTQFGAEPMIEHLFSLMDLDEYIEHTLMMERDDKTNSVVFKRLDEDLESLKQKAASVEEALKLKYPVTPIAYFNKEGNDAGTINNFSRDKQVKVIVGEEELEQFFEKYVFHGRFQYTVEELEAVIDEIEHLNP